MKEFNRRSFFRLAVAPVIGILAEQVLSPVADKAEYLVASTGLPTGNAYVDSKLKSKCEKEIDSKHCLQQVQFTEEEKFDSSYIHPFNAELVWRVLPSMILDIVSEADFESIKPAINIICGSGGVGMKKPEVITGIVSSVLFGAAHNYTLKGWSTEMLPVSPTVGGFGLWYLQRKFGYFSNTAAHIMRNLRASG